MIDNSKQCKSSKCCYSIFENSFLEFSICFIGGFNMPNPRDGTRSTYHRTSQKKNTSVPMKKRGKHLSQTIRKMSWVSHSVQTPAVFHPVDYDIGASWYLRGWKISQPRTPAGGRNTHKKKQMKTWEHGVSLSAGELCIDAINAGSGCSVVAQFHANVPCNTDVSWRQGGNKFWQNKE